MEDIPLLNSSGSEMIQGGRKRKRGATGSMPGVSGAGWEQERVDADSLLRSLHQAHVEKETLGASLRERWPRGTGDGSSGPQDAERFIAESFLRDQDYDAITNLVSKNVALLGQEGVGDEEDEEDVDFIATVSRLSDDGVLEALPKYLQRLQGKALCSILSILSRKTSKAKNAPWLIKRINKEWGKVSQSHSEGKAVDRISRSILAVLRDPQSYRKEMPGMSFVIEATCPLSAARSTVSQLEKLPLKCLQVMLEILDERPVTRNIGTLPVGGNKDCVTSKLVSIFRRLLSDHQPGEELPVLVRRSLIVASVSARFAFGHDGQLMDFLGPTPPEVQTLHERLLTALTDLKAINHGNLKQVSRELSGDPTLKENRHSLIIRKPIRNAILDYLLRSEIRSVPEDFKAVLNTIRELAKQQAETKPVASGTCRPEANPTDQEKIESEVEAVLVISSHMQQLMLNWNERASGSTRLNQRLGRNVNMMCTEAEKGTAGSQSDGEFRACPTQRGSSGENAEEYAADGVSPMVETDLVTETSAGKMRRIDGSPENKFLAPLVHVAQRETDSHDLLVEEEEESCRLRRIADETSQIGYTLVGCAMEKVASASGVALNKQVRSYLRGDMRRSVSAKLGSETNAEQNQVDMVLAIAESIPAIPSSGDWEWDNFKPSSSFVVDVDALEIWDLMRIPIWQTIDKDTNTGGNSLGVYKRSAELLKVLLLWKYRNPEVQSH